MIKNAAALLLLAAPPRASAADVLEAPPLTVTAKPRPSPTLTSPSAVSVVGGRALERERRATLAQTVESQPGAASFTTGAGIAKPVIRGLSGQRVLVLTDGIRQEGQQWGAEHGPEVDVRDAERVEVLRGPHSLLYGPEAISGVINVIRRPLPLEAEGSVFRGRAALDAFSYNSQIGGSMRAEAGANGLAASAGFGGRDGKDMRTPTGKLRNSGLAEKTADGAVGIRKGWGTVTADFARFDQKLQIHEDPSSSPTATPYQRIEHDKTRVRAEIPLEKLTLETSASWQRNARREFEAAADAEPKLRLVLDTYTADIRLKHEGIGPTSGAVGVSGLGQKNDTQATEKLIPGYTMHDLGAFVFEELALGDVTVSGGGRYDARRLFVKREADLGVTARTLEYQSLSGSLGAAWAFRDGWAAVANVGVGWRAPSPFELFINGEHEGASRFEVGRADLRPERSINADVSLRHQGERAQGELSVFRNRVNRFIYAQPTGTTDSGSGLPIFNIAQANATIIGAEALVKGMATDWLQLSAGGDVMEARNDDRREPLPQIPANRVKWGARVLPPAAGPFKGVYVSAGGKAAAHQNKVAANEARSRGYTLWDFGVGGEWHFAGGEAHVDLAVENAFDRRYADHLNRWRAFALSPGRNVALRVSVPFGSK